MRWSGNALNMGLSSSDLISVALNIFKSILLLITNYIFKWYFRHFSQLLQKYYKILNTFNCTYAKTF